MHRAIHRALALLLPALAAVMAALPIGAAAGGASFSTPGQGIDHIDKHRTVMPGDIVSVGFAVHPNGLNHRATLYLLHTSASIRFGCAGSGAGAGTLTIPIPAGPYAVPANDSGWIVTNTWSNHASYQSSAAAPNWCNGGPLSVVDAGETYAGSLGSPDNTLDSFQIQLHTAIPATLGGANISCADAAQNATQAGGKGITSCDFNPNGYASGLTAAAYTPPTPNPQNPGPTSGSGQTGTSGTPGPSQSQGSSGSLPVSSDDGPLSVFGSASAAPPPAFATSPSSGVGAHGPAGNGATASGVAGVEATPTAAPPVVFNPLGPSGVAQIRASIGTPWVPLAVVAGVLFAVAVAVLTVSRRRRLPPAEPAP